MWSWLAKHPEMTKRDYMMIHELEEVMHDCYLCEYVEGTDGPSCEECPVRWETKNNFCHFKGSAYSKWYFNRRSPKDKRCTLIRIACARHVADLAQEALTLLDMRRQHAKTSSISRHRSRR